MKKRIQTLVSGLLLLTAALIFTGLAASTVGAAGVSLADCIKIIGSTLPVLGAHIDISALDPSSALIILKIRLPRIVLAALIGMALSASGAVFQGIFKNPMADPYVLGVSSGAAVGATAVILAGVGGSILGFSVLTIGAFVGAMATALLVYSIARTGGKTPVITLLLAGIAVNFFLSAVISTAMAINKDQMERIIYWTMGSVATANWLKVLTTGIPVILGVILITFYARDLNAMSLGEDNARSLGIDSEKLKKRLLVLSSIVTASAVAVSGIIGFVGLVVPHVVRMATGPDHRTLLPFSTLAGAIFMILADTLSRTLVAPAEMPLGVITSLFGAPYFLLLLYRGKSKLAGR